MLLTGLLGLLRQNFNLIDHYWHTLIDYVCWPSWWQCNTYWCTSNSRAFYKDVKTKFIYSLVEITFLQRKHEDWDQMLTLLNRAFLCKILTNFNLIITWWSTWHVKEIIFKILIACINIVFMSVIAINILSKNV